MSEIMRFRLARAPQKHAVDPDTRIPLLRGRDNLETDTLHAAVLDLLRDPTPFVIGYTLNSLEILDKPADLKTKQLDPFEKWLTKLENRPSDEELSYQLQILGDSLDPAGGIAPGDLQTNAARFLRLAGNNWWIDRLNISLSLIVAMLRDSEPSRAIYLNRLMLVIGLVELAKEHPERFRTANDVYWALKSRSVILPQNLVDYFRRGDHWLSRWQKGTTWKPLVGDFGRLDNDPARKPKHDEIDDVVMWNSQNGSWQVALSDGTKFRPKSGVAGNSHWLTNWAKGKNWVPLVGDFNGDGTDDITVYYPHTGDWHIAFSDGTQFTADPGPAGDGLWLTNWGTGTDWVPLVGDFNGDGIDDIAVYYPHTGDWHIAFSDGTQFTADLGPAGDGLWLTNWGTGTDWVPLVGDFNGDGIDDIAVWKRSAGECHVAFSDGTQFTPKPGPAGQWRAWITQWGYPETEWMPLVGDFNGDGKDDLAVWKPSAGAWHVAFSDGTQFTPKPGPAGPWQAWLNGWARGKDWVPLVGDFNGDGKDDVAVWNSRSGDFWVAISDGTMFFNRPNRSLLARRPGMTDLYVVREEWAKYEAGEIAHIENVMAGEKRERSHTRITETEETTTTEEERTKFDEHDTQTTDRFDLHQETSRDSSLNVSADGSVDVKAEYGKTTEVAAHLGGSLDYSINESQSKATTTAQEIVARAVTRLEQKVRQVRTTRSLSRIEEINKHGFENNAAGSTHITGIYRWVNKIKHVQIFRYPHRFLLEFQVPEPGAWLRYLLDKKKKPTISENPATLTRELSNVEGVPNGSSNFKIKNLIVQYTNADNTAHEVILGPEHITRKNYLEIAALYKIYGGLNPPPADKIIAIAITHPAKEEGPGADKQPVRFKIDRTLAVPDGYKAKEWKATVQSWHNSLINNNAGMNVFVAVGSEHSADPQWVSSTAAVAKDSLMDASLTGNVGGISVGSIPISIMTNTAHGLNINITVKCEPLPQTRAAWKLETYGEFARVHYAMKREYDEEIKAQSIGGGVQIEGQSPVQNAEMARVEIKKAVIEMLTARDFTGRNAYQLHPDDHDQRQIPPEVDLIKAVENAPEIQFIEQAFEWENMTYVLYPYFWTDKDEWEELANLSSADPDFARFLRAGSARVVVPARPGFNEPAWLYVYLGILWGGGPAPAPGEDDYLSVAEEIRAQEKPPRDGHRGESWPVRLPTTLVWLDTGNSGLPIVNSDKELDDPPE